METVNERNKGTSTYIENIAEKGSIISSDETFFNASKESIQRALEN
jgi:hypothetical protein